tara:strand:- start:3168 stop:4523 length:1356 start_codon:yes stop_codon:yes gene_type:complete
MSDLENQVENTEEVLDEVKQPHDGAEQGDKSAVKQGSSDAEKIESGKGEVVKPEENPVDKAVASVKSAEKAPSNEGDPQKKGASAPEKGEKLKEGEEESKVDEATTSKMENIKAVVDKMKGLDKASIKEMLASLSEEDEEVDESLTKAEVARKVVESLKAMSQEDVQKFVESYEDEEEEDEDEKEEQKEETVDEETSAELESSLVEIEIDDDLSKISEALELSEENSEKAKTIFKAAVSSKVEEIKESLESQYSEELKTSVEKVKADLSEAVDKYLSYCAEEWTKENELAIERGLRSEMTENFIEGLKTLFVEHYVEVPEDKYNVVDELANRLDEMEQKLDAEVQKNIDINEELGSLKRENVVKSAGEDLTESQREKLVSLSNGVDFTDEADFEEKIAEIKEAYFKVDGETVSEETVVEEGTGEFASDEEKVLDPSIARYSEALTKLKPLG